MILATCIVIAVIAFVVVFYALEGWRLDAERLSKGDKK